MAGRASLGRRRPSWEGRASKAYEATPARQLFLFRYRPANADQAIALMAAAKRLLLREAVFR